jgi:hypothetical protein
LSLHRSRLIAVSLSLVAAVRAAAAQSDDRQLDFSADEVEGQFRRGEKLELRGHVVMTYQRFRLTSPKLAVYRSWRGVEVEGPGEVVFCPCPDPPVSVGFDSGVVAPPADLILRRPSLRVGSVTVLRLPWFWLRAPSRAGVLPPTVAWRGGDGLLVGDGIHVPWRYGTPSAGELDLTAAAYVKGGVEIVVRLRTERSTEKLRWDHLGGDLLALDANGSADQASGGSAAWDVDAIRGPRARSATLSLDEAARAYDRAAFDLSLPERPAIVAMGVRAIGVRGGSGPTEQPAWGPRAVLGVGGAIGPVGAWDGLATLSVLQDRDFGMTQLARGEGGAEIAARPGPLVATLGLRATAIAADSADGAGGDAVAAARVSLGAPFARAWATDDAPLVHVIEPLADATAMAAHTSGAYWAATGRPVALGGGRALVASSGLRSAWGRLLGRSGASVTAAVGAASTTDTAAPTSLARWRAAWSSRYVGLGLEGASLLARPGQVVIGQARVGDRNDWYLRLNTAGRRGVEPVLARAIGSAAAREPSGGWLATPGWSAGGEVGGRLLRSVTINGGVDQDVSARTLLSVRGSVGYQHPCRCLSVDTFVAHRLGREGVDFWVSIDLAPR